MYPYAEISAEELKARLDAGERIHLIDVREPEEVAQGMLPGAVHIPLGQVPQRLADIPKHEEVVIVCRSGYRSGQACGYLAMLGYEKPVNLAGGMLAWQAL